MSAPVRGASLAIAVSVVIGGSLPAWADGTTERVSVGPGGRAGRTATATSRRSRRTGASSPSHPTPPTWCRATPTARATSSSATARRARPSGSASARGGAQGNERQPRRRRSRRTGASSPSSRRPPTWCRATPTASSGRVRPRPPDGHDRAGQRRHGRRRRATASSCDPAISADGRFVAFSSSATNLVPGDTNGTRRRVRPRPPDGHDRAGERRAGRRPGRLAPAAARRSRRTGASSPSARRHQPGAGRHQRRRRRLRPRPPDGHDRAGQRRRRAAPRATAAARGPAISADGRFVAFDSDATNLVPGDTNGVHDVFVRDRRTGTTERVSVGRGGAQGNGPAIGPAISADGRFVAF